MAVDFTYDILDDDSAVSHLLNCTNNVSPIIMDAIADAEPIIVRDCFENDIIPRLRVERRAHIVCALIDLLLKDDAIPENERIGTITSNTKRVYRDEVYYDLAEFLTDFFFFAIQSCDNKSGRSYIEDVNPEYIRSFEDKKDTIILKTTGESADLTISAQGKGFDDAFVYVAKASLGLNNPEDCQIYRLKIEDNVFSYQELGKYLTINIGRYVFSRTRVDRDRDKGELEGLGLEAAQYLRDNSTGNELADMLLYAFLEEVLGAPKLFSSIEIGPASNGVGVHLRSLDGPMPAHQLVYGSSCIKGDLKAAIDSAFDAIINIKTKRITGERLVNSAVLDISVDRPAALAIKEILVPTKKNQNPPGTAFGVFLGYSLGLNPEDYSASEFIEEAVEKMENDIQAAASYIQEKIRGMKLSMHSFYIYVLPFNNAVDDKTSIINRLIGGGA